MYTKLILIQHDYENDNTMIHVKYTIYKLFATINELREFSNGFAKFIIILGMLQIASTFKTTTTDDYSESLPILSIILNHLNYIQTIDKKYLLYLNYCIYFNTILTIFSCVYCSFCILKKKFHYYFPFTHLMYFFFLYEWVLFLPNLMILSANLKTDSPTLVRIIDILLIVLYIILGYVVGYFNMISNLGNKDFFSVLENSSSLNYFSLMVLCYILKMLNTFDSDFIFIVYACIFMMLIKMTIDSFHWMHHWNTEFFIYFVVGLGVLYERLLNCILSEVFSIYYGTPYRDFYITTLLATLIIYVLLRFIYLPIIENICMETENSQIKTPEVLIKFINSIMMQINENHEKKIILLAGFMEKHRETCIHANCPIKVKNKLIIPLTSQTSDDSKQFYRDEVIVYYVIKEIFNDFYHLFHNNFDFCLNYVKFIMFQLGNFEMALTEIELIREMDLNISQEFILYLLKEYCNDNIVKNTEKSDSRLKQEIQWSSVNMLNVLKYDKYCNDLVKLIFICSDIKKQLWKTLQMKNIYVEDIFEVGNQYYSTKDKLQKKWEIINEISSDKPHSEILNIYCNFLLKICYDEIESEKILDKKHKLTLSGNDELFINRFKNDTGVVVIDANKNSRNPGIINYVNKAFLKMVKFNKKHELLGTNICSLMPSVLGNYHDEIIIKHYENGHSEHLRKTLSGLCLLNKEKYLVPIHLLISTLPSIGNSVDGIGIFRKRQREDEIIITDKMGTINSMTKGISDLLDISPEKLDTKAYCVQTIFPEFLRTELDGTPKFFSNEIMRRVTEFRFKLFLPKTSKEFKNINSYDSDCQLYRVHSSMNLAINDTSQIYLSQNNSPLQNYHPKILPQKNNLDLSSTVQKTSSKKKLNNVDKVQLYFNSSYLDFSTIHKEFLSKNFFKYHTNVDFKEKILQFYNFNSVLFTKERKYENKEISFTQICTKILGGRTMFRTIIIPSEQLFEKKIDDAAESSECKSEIGERSNKLNKGTKKKKAGGEANDIGSVKGTKKKVSNLEDNLKRFRSYNKKNNLMADKLIGILMIFTILSITISSFYLFIMMLNYSKNYNKILNYSLNQNSYFVDLCRYTYSISLINTFRIDNFNNLDINEKENLNSTYRNIIKNEINLLDYTDIFNYYSKDLDKLQLFQNNFFLNQPFNNALYIMILNAIMGEVNMINYLIENSLNFVKFYYNNINSLMDKNFTLKINNYQIITACILIAGLILVIFLLSVLFFSYKNKKDRHNKILKAYEALSAEELKNLVYDIDTFEKKYFENFKDLDDFKQRRSKIINAKNAMMSRGNTLKHSPTQKMTPLVRKQTLSVRSQQQLLNNNSNMNELVIKKEFLNRSNMTLNYIFSVIMIFTFIIGYKAFIYIFFTSYIKVCITSKDLIKSLLENKFELNYLASKMEDNFYRKTFNQYLQIENNLNPLVNLTVTNFLSLTHKILDNTYLFQSNITDIISGDLCSIYPYLKSCNLNILVHQSGLKSLTSYYLQKISDAQTNFQENYRSIKDIPILYTKMKFVVVRFLIENIKIIYDDVFRQLNYYFENIVDNGYIVLIIIGIIFNVFFFFLMIIRLRQFIDNLVKEENLCNRLVTEIPMDIINSNKEFRDNLSVCFRR